MIPTTEWDLVSATSYRPRCAWGPCGCAHLPWCTDRALEDTTATNALERPAPPQPAAGRVQERMLVSRLVSVHAICFASVVSARQAEPEPVAWSPQAGSPTGRILLMCATWRSWRHACTALTTRSVSDGVSPDHRGGHNGRIRGNRPHRGSRPARAGVDRNDRPRPGRPVHDGIARGDRLACPPTSVAPERNQDEVRNSGMSERFVGAGPLRPSGRSGAPIVGAGMSAHHPHQRSSPAQRSLELTVLEDIFGQSP